MNWRWRHVEYYVIVMSRGVCHLQSDDPYDNPHVGGSSILHTEAEMTRHRLQ